jgi:TetR/AcrR family transcriptional repressor of nem operon
MARTKTFDPDQALTDALGLFWRRGYSATSIQDLVDELGINRGSLYGTFGSKHDLFVAALGRYCREAPDPIIEALEADGPLLVRLRGMMIGLVDRDLAGPDRKGCFLINSAMELPDDEATTALFVRTTDSIHRAMESAISSAQALGEIDSRVSPGEAATFLLTTLQGVRVMAKATGNRKPLVVSIDLALDSLR